MRYAMVLTMALLSLTPPAINAAGGSYEPSDGPMSALDSSEQAILQFARSTMRLEDAAPTRIREVALAWINSTPPEMLVAIETAADNQNDSTLSIMLVISQLERKNAQTEALQVLDGLDARVPALAHSPRQLRARAKLTLSVGRAEEARLLAKEIEDSGVSACAGKCGDMVRQWLATGDVTATSNRAKLVGPFDPRPAKCSASKSSAMAVAISDADVLLALKGTQVVARHELAAWWPRAIAGCEDRFSTWELRQKIGAAWSPDDLREQLAAANALMDKSVPSSIPFLGVELDLPQSECDFGADPSCRSATVALRLSTARSILQRLRGVSDAFAAAGACPAPPSEAVAAKRGTLSTRYEATLASILKLSVRDSIARLRETLAQSEWSSMGSELRSFGFDQIIDRISRSSQSEAALELYRMALVAGDESITPSSSTSVTLAILELRSGDAKAALQTLEASDARGYDANVHAAVEQIRAAMAGARLDDERAGTIKRPWAWSDDDVSCDDYSVDGLFQVRARDIVVGTRGARAGLGFDLLSHWRSVLGNCPISTDKSKAMSQLQALVGSAALDDLRTAAVESLVLGDDAQFVFDGREFPLPDRACAHPECLRDADAVMMTRERALELMRKGGFAPKNAKLADDGTHAEPL